MIILPYRPPLVKHEFQLKCFFYRQVTYTLSFKVLGSVRLFFEEINTFARQDQMWKWRCCSIYLHTEKKENYYAFHKNTKQHSTDNENVSWAANQHIRIISKGSCDTEDWSNDAENSALHHRNKPHFIIYSHRKQWF